MSKSKQGAAAARYMPEIFCANCKYGQSDCGLISNPGDQTRKFHTQFFWHGFSKTFTATEIRDVKCEGFERDE
jgi:hypothetical protein